MKLELKENMHIRNCYGRIAKIEYIEDNTAYCDNWLYQSYEDYITFINLNDEEDINEITKASYNIIDILEVGDVIIDKEGHKYPINYEFETDYNGEYKSYEITIDDYITLFLKDGLSIVTHEQIEQKSYKIEE